MEKSQQMQTITKIYNSLSSHVFKISSCEDHLFQHCCYVCESCVECDGLTYCCVCIQDHQCNWAEDSEDENKCGDGSRLGDKNSNSGTKQKMYSKSSEWLSRQRECIVSGIRRTQRTANQILNFNLSSLKLSLTSSLFPHSLPHFQTISELNTSIILEFTNYLSHLRQKIEVNIVEPLIKSEIPTLMKNYYEDVSIKLEGMAEEGCQTGDLRAVKAFKDFCERESGYTNSKIEGFINKIETQCEDYYRNELIEYCLNIIRKIKHEDVANEQSKLSLEEEPHQQKSQCFLENQRTLAAFEQQNNMLKKQLLSMQEDSNQKSKLIEEMRMKIQRLEGERQAYYKLYIDGKEKLAESQKFEIDETVEKMKNICEIKMQEQQVENMMKELKRIQEENSVLKKLVPLAEKGSESTLHSKQQQTQTQYSISSSGMIGVPFLKQNYENSFQTEIQSQSPLLSESSIKQEKHSHAVLETSEHLNICETSFENNIYSECPSLITSLHCQTAAQMLKSFQSQRMRKSWSMKDVQESNVFLTGPQLSSLTHAQMMRSYNYKEKQAISSRIKLKQFLSPQKLKDNGNNFKKPLKKNRCKVVKYNNA